MSAAQGAYESQLYSNLLTSFDYINIPVQKSPYSRVQCVFNFLSNPYSSNINTSANLYNYAVSALNDFYNDVNVKYPNKIVVTATDQNGVVWYYNDGTTTKNTLNNFYNNAIQTNQNTRPSYIESLISDSGYGFESSIVRTSSGSTYNSNLVQRIGSSKKTPVGCIALSVISN